jgi:RimJ/RimL family protein N-acetyltransferase
VTLETGRLVLRPVEPGDAAAIEPEISRYEVSRNLLSVPWPYEPGTVEEWIRGATPGVHFAIEHDGELVGVISLSVTESDARGELGYWIAVGHWGKGYATEAVRALVEHGFRDLGLNKVHAGVFGDNPASGRVLEKAGMRREGVRRQHHYRLDRWCDLVHYGILREEWSEQSS